MNKFFAPAFAFMLLISPSFAQEGSKEPIKIGNINLGVGAPEYGIPHQNGVNLAVSEINAKGGVKGRPLQILFRDSKFNPGEAVRLAEELLMRDKITALIGGDGSSGTLAVSAWAKHNKIPFVVSLADADSILWEQGHPYVFRTLFGGYMQVAAIMDKAVEIYGDKLKNKRWAIIAPNYEYGRSIVKYAKIIVEERGLNPTWAVEQWPAFGKLDAGATLGALRHVKPDIVFSMLLSDDLAKFVRAGTTRGFFKDKIMIAPAAAVPENFVLLGKEMPTGWISLGFPADEIKEPGFVKFRNDYVAAHKTLPTTISFYAYNAVYAVAAALEKAGPDDPAKIRDALEEISYPTPFGEERFRKLDHQANTVFWVGVTGVKDGKPALLDWRMERAEDHLPPDVWIKEKMKNTAP